MILVDLQNYLEKIISLSLDEILTPLETFAHATGNCQRVKE